MNELEILDRLEEAARSGGEADLLAANYALGSLLLETGEYSAAIFDGVTALLADHAVVAQPHAWLLWKQFEENCDALTPEQRKTLTELAELAFDASEHWMWSFTIGVVLAECVRNAEALEIMRRLSRSARTTARALLPDAIASLGRREPDLRVAAKTLVEVLTRDSAEEVRKEAGAALAKLSR